MNAIQSASAQSAASSESTINAVCDTSNMLHELWERASPSLSDSELEWFAGASEHAGNIVGNLRHVVEGIGCLVANDGSGQDISCRAGNFQSANSVSSLLFSIENQLDSLQGLINIGDSAGHRLRNPDLYRRIEGCTNPESPDALALRYPINAKPFAIWFNKTAAEENSPDPWAVNDANGNPVFDLPSLQVAQYVAERLKRLGGTASAMKGGAI